MMSDSSTSSGWIYMEQGLLDKAYSVMTEEIAAWPDSSGYYMNRGLCLLNMNRPEDALKDFRECIRLSPDADAGYISAGIALWWLKKQQEAIQTWQQGLGAKYRDAAGGVEVPALLYFGAFHLANAKMETKARSLLKRKWRPRLAKIWPGPIAGFLLGEMDEETFLVKQTYPHPNLESRRLCQAHFWVGVSYLRQGNQERYKYHLQLSLLTNAVIESEYYPSKSELQTRINVPPTGTT